MESLKSKLLMGGTFTLICRAKDGAIKWAEKTSNMVVAEGINHILDVTFTGATQTNPFYCGLTDATPTLASGDTLASHAGWTELTIYTGDRQAYVDVRSDHVVSNTASKASFYISTAGTVGGALMTDAATGSSGILLCEAALTGSNRSVVDGDTVSLTYTFTGADA